MIWCVKISVMVETAPASVMRQFRFLALISDNQGISSMIGSGNLWTFFSNFIMRNPWKMIRVSCTAIHKYLIVVLRGLMLFTMILHDPHVCRLIKLFPQSLLPICGSHGSSESLIFLCGFLSNISHCCAVKCECARPDYA